MNEIKQKLRAIETAKSNLKQHWFNLMLESQEYLNLQNQLLELQKECESIGHIHGNYHDNGLGWEWYYCKNCGASFDKRYYLSAAESVED